MLQRPNSARSISEQHLVIGHHCFESLGTGSFSHSHIPCVAVHAQLLY